MSAQPEAPLSGITVIDLSHVYNGPYATFLMAMAGATVIKVEPHGGEHLRSRGDMGGAALPFAMLNSNKRCVTLNLKAEQGKALLREMAARADVLVENFAPGVMDRLGLGAEALRALNPRLIYGSSSGYGKSGPYRDYPAMDLVMQDMSGVIRVTGHADQPPVKAGPALCDFSAGVHLYGAIMTALYERERTGKGRVVEVSMQDATYASLATLLEVGFNHFFRAANAETGHGGDLVFFQPHSAPGIYARAFLEGRLSEEQITNYRQELTGQGLCSYPHPWLMPDFWQFPTGSMGIGPISAIYQARFLRYLRDRGLATATETPERHVWGVFGDGEMDEPESIGALTLAVREKLDNVTFVINCNLQRLDGPVRGNGQIIQELESLFTGAGWNVVKVLWGSDWDALFGIDHTHILLKTFAATVDGKYQTLGAMDGLYNAEHFFGQDPELKKLVAHMSDREIDALRRGGHDLRKLHAAFAAAQANKGRPTVILAKTKKGFGMGAAGESRNTSHTAKKLDA